MNVEESSPAHGQDRSRQTRFLIHATGETIEILPGSIREVELISREIFQDHVYTQHGVAVRAGDVVMDVGANIGMFYLHSSLASLGRAGEMLPPVDYYGFEALPPIFEVLKRNVAAVRRDRTVKTLFNVAIGDEVRDGVPFTYYPLIPGNSTLNPKEKERLRIRNGRPESERFEGATEYVVPMRTISDVLEELGMERVDYLKVDVEGAELMVLKGVKEADWSRIGQVVAEVSDAEEAGDEGIVPVKRVNLIIKLLKEHGFEVNLKFDSWTGTCMVYGRRIL